MRLANDRDQALLRSAVTDAASNLLAFVPSLGTREAVGFGEGMRLPARFTFNALPEACVPHCEAVALSGARVAPTPGKAFVRAVVERWRGAKPIDESTAPRAEPAPSAPKPAPVASRIDQIRAPSPIASRINEIRAQMLQRAT
jgi:hypothetical protein